MMSNYVYILVKRMVTPITPSKCVPERPVSHLTSSASGKSVTVQWNRSAPPRIAGFTRTSEIERLSLLRLAIAAGHSIGNIAKLPLARLKLLVAKANGTEPTAPASKGLVRLRPDFS